ncbi:MAG: hypothetical protein QW478_04190 [Candidatus Micrarchaeaceae archaeon]
MSQKKEEYLPILVPSLGMSVHSSVAFILIPTLMRHQINFVSNTISKTGTPIARQMLVDSLKMIEKKVKVIKNEKGEYFTLWVDDDIVVDEQSSEEVAQCVEKRENCVWNYPLLDRPAINESEGIYGFGLATLWIPPNYKFRSGWFPDRELYMSEDVAFFQETGIKPTIKSNVKHFKKVLLSL